MPSQHATAELPLVFNGRATPNINSLYSKCLKQKTFMVYGVEARKYGELRWDRGGADWIADQLAAKVHDETHCLVRALIADHGRTVEYRFGASYGWIGGIPIERILPDVTLMRRYFDALAGCVNRCRIEGKTDEQIFAEFDLLITETKKVALSLKEHLKRTRSGEPHPTI